MVPDTGFWLVFLGVLVGCYLLGSLNFAVIVSRIYAKDDIRNHGSGNAGMTNMLRTYGKGPAFFTGLGDFAKGAAAVLLARAAFEVVAASGGGAVVVFDGGLVGTAGVLLGHLFPLYFHFKGGKGILTVCGAILLLNPIVFVILFVVFVPIAFITRIVSLASVTGALAFPALTYATARLQGRPPLLDTAFAAVCMVIILVMHRENIKRLLSGTEKRIGKAPAKEPSKHPPQ